MKIKILIVGAGVIGLSVARALLEQHPNLGIYIVDKEDSVGKHASGRNSGVIHAGFYYSPESLKAKFCREGNESLKQLCEEHKIPIKEVGKVVVARTTAEVSHLESLFQRGIANGVNLSLLPASELIRYEPLARTLESFIWSPTTAVSNPQLVLAALLNSVKSLGANVLLGARLTFRQDSTLVSINGENIKFKHIINTAGSQADRIAHDFGFGKDLSMIPFMGIYRAVNHAQLPLSTLVYPVPDPMNPFLGVHLTSTVNGKVKIGPTAIPLFNREQYRFSEGWSAKDFGTSASGLLAMLRGDKHNLPKLALTELPKIFLKRLIKDAATLVPDVVHIKGWQRLSPGIRSQLINLKSGSLLSDFVIEGDEHSTHVLNAVSPGWTAAIPFGRYIANQVVAQI
jgi:L-2-hydroxyglutarate oxidase